MIVLTLKKNSLIEAVDEEGNDYGKVQNINCASQCWECREWFTIGWAKLPPIWFETHKLEDVELYLCEKEVKVVS